MTTDELRQRYLGFFKAKQHQVFASDSLVPADDPSLLFTGAGMNQFKPYFLGLKKDVKRAASCQKCLRTADLERVGKTAYHHSFFEMLGNFSFGDYFKESAIEWGWEFVTRELRLPKERLWVSVYEKDEEAFGIWKKKIGLAEAKIVRMGPEDNFWPSNAPKNGPNGPCGPCSEIYVGEKPGKGVEIWNLVFTQFDRQSDGSLKDLPQKNIDTGMGLERTAAVLQGVESNFETDNFQNMRTKLHALLAMPGKETAHENAVLDHIRAITFSIADGALPSNEGRGYVVRKIIRLASDHFQKAGARESGTLCRLVGAVTEVYGKIYPEIAEREKTVSAILANEEASFLEVVRTRVPELKRLLQEAKPDPLDLAKLAFKYYDTYGLTFDQIELSANSVGKVIEKKLFDRLMEEQKRRSRESSKIAGEIFAKSDFYEWVQGLPPTRFTGYEGTETAGAKLLRAIGGQKPADRLAEGEEGLLIFDQSPFYAEAGGQIGDMGMIESASFKAKVLDAQWLEKCIAHKVFVEKGAAEVGQSFRLKVESDRRADIMKNHTATHLLHSALRKVLGDHVKQSGSLVAKDYLRFDFTHFGAVGEEALQKVEALVNAEIAKNTVLSKKEMTKEEAVKEGAIAFFGEKYGDRVRVVSIGDFSKELCGGTHLESTGQIGSFKIVSESSIQAGVRRIEAVTGRAAEHLVRRSDQEIREILNRYHLSESNLKEAFQQYQRKTKDLRSKLFSLIDKKMKEETKIQFEKAPEKGGIKHFYMTVPLADIELIKSDVQYLKSQNQPFISLFRADSSDKFSYVVTASTGVISAGWDSHKAIQILNQKLGGSGGGRQDFAVGGSKHLELKHQTFEVFKAGTADMIDSIKMK